MYKRVSDTMKSAVEKKSLQIKSSGGVGGRCLVRPIERVEYYYNHVDIVDLRSRSQRLPSYKQQPIVN